MLSFVTKTLHLSACGAIASAGLLALPAASPAAAPNDARAEVRRHIEAARSAAGQDHAFIFGRLCEDPIKAVGAAPPVGEVPAQLPSSDPSRPWYTPPARVFDDLYFLGQTAFSVWALKTSEGFILVDAIFDYSVEAEVIDMNAYVTRGGLAYPFAGKGGSRWEHSC